MNLAKGDLSPVLDIALAMQSYHFFESWFMKLKHRLSVVNSDPAGSSTLSVDAVERVLKEGKNPDIPAVGSDI